MRRFLQGLCCAPRARFADCSLAHLHHLASRPPAPAPPAAPAPAHHGICRGVILAMRCLPHYLLLFANFFLLLLSPSPTMTAGDVAILMDMLKPALQGAAPNAQLTTWNASMPLCL
ncbi:hypothetical protein ZWY2020_021729 [Hordeum vulgare]|nr:hypothetical protein ZWY2020_021729 [Hordeum vulgare]